MSEYQALPDLDANANAVAIQHIKLENEGWERDADLPEPVETSFDDPRLIRRRIAVLTECNLLALWEAGTRDRTRSGRALPCFAATGRRRRVVGPPTCPSVSGRSSLSFAPAGAVLRFDVSSAWSAGPECRQELELQLTADQVRSTPPSRDLNLTLDGVDVRFRLITTRDLLEHGQRSTHAGRCSRGW